MSLVAWYPLTGDGTNHGAYPHDLIGTPKAWADGKIGKCPYFENNLSNILYNTTKDYYYTDNFSYCAWVKPMYFTGNGSEWAFTCGRADYSTYGYGIQIVDGYIRLWYGLGYCAVPVKTDMSTWYHVCCVVRNKVGYVYLNGEYYSSFTPSVLPSYGAGDVNGIGIGAFWYAGKLYPYQGYINDLRIYDHSLSLKEIKEIYKGLIVHYTFNDIDDNTTPTIAYDSSGYNNTAEMANITIFKNLSKGSTPPPTSSAIYLGSNNCRFHIKTPFGVGVSFTELTTSIWFSTTTFNSTAPNFFSLCHNLFWRTRIQDGVDNAVWIYWRHENGNTGITFKCNNATLLDGNWHHYVATYKNGLISAYIDGVLIGTYQHSTSVLYQASADWWRIGSYTDGYECFNGYFADPKIYVTALTAEDVYNEYKSRASLASNGTLFTGNFIETETTCNAKLPKTDREIVANTITEGSDTLKVYKDGRIACREIIEN